MKGQRIVFALTALNLVFVLIVLTYGHSAIAQTEQTVLRAEVIELVDRQGQVRAQLTVE